MLTNVPLKHVPHDLDRRWIADDYFDLIVWYEPDGRVHGFQLCYDKRGRERAFTWTRDSGFLHAAVDSGESNPTANRTPFMVQEGTFTSQLVKHEFIARSAALLPELRELVLARIDEYERQHVIS